MLERRRSRSSDPGRCRYRARRQENFPGGGRSETEHPDPTRDPLAPSRRISQRGATDLTLEAAPAQRCKQPAWQ